MLYNTTTYYKTQDHTEILQTLQERYAGGHGQRPAGSASAAKRQEARRGVFRGRPTLSPSAPGFVRPGRSWTAWARCPALACIVPGDASSSAGGRHRRKWEAGQLVGLVGVAALPSCVQPAAVTPALAFEVGHGLGKPLFLAKPGFSWLSSAAALDEGEGWSWYRAAAAALW
jgi:hypothetical protein